MTAPPFLSPDARFFPVPDAWREAFFPAKLCLFEWTDYWFQWPGATHLQVGEKRVEPLAPGLFRVRFENAIGAAHIEPMADGNPLDEPLFVEVLSPKFPTPNAHFHFLGALLDDLFERAAPLPFDVRGQTSRGVETSDLPPSPLWTRWFLNSHGARLEAALRHFLAHPSRDFELESVRLPSHQAARFDADALISTVRDAAAWTRSAGKMIPSHITQNRARQQLDTPENRFVAALARRLITALNTLQTHNASLRGLCASLSARFPLWNDEIRVSSGLERRAVTRELVELWRLWRGAGAPLFGRFERVARLRDIAQLWEFWTFFALCDEIGAALGQTPRLEIAGDESRGLLPLSKAHFGASTLVFNGPAPSYSTALRPDFLWLQIGVAQLAFDAKFRFEGDEAGTGRGKGADLHKMHAYRDALGVRAALALHPGTQSVFFDRERGPLHHFSWRALLEGNLSGVGLRALTPTR
ncbi:MAG TPA: DUF2357 domain-containing protein [Abditibacterium sp.]|jgi:hypothetical protein